VIALSKLAYVAALSTLPPVTARVKLPVSGPDMISPACSIPSARAKFPGFRRTGSSALADWEDEQKSKTVPLTYLIFYKDDERVGRKFEAWPGALGTSS
jgi:hypothetical protein